ncbi:CGNR zinc finger domain-containing protein [Nonomuraea sp. NPDC050691]|uniref:CGNR zinc finger domain-containing protein n=1 Tax=Nonomuraea sp. NPDC050691 TaxID=3155661 RepID=UPI0033C9B0FF
MTLDSVRITGQPDIDSYVSRSVDLAAVLVNGLTVTSAHGRPVTPPPSPTARLAAIASQSSSTSLTPADADRLTDIAAQLSPAFSNGEPPPDVAARLNDLLARHGAVPNLHGAPGGPLTLAFHRSDATLVDAWAADLGTALVMVIGVGQAARLGRCRADACDLVFFDTTRNTSRHFCDLSCQNRAKASAYRARRRA